MRHEPILHVARERGSRHFGMDWLRIGAFGILIFHHIGMVFAPWKWVVKASPTSMAFVPPMALVMPWRLALLFAVSGYASRKLMDRTGSIAAFLRSRSRRLLIPLAFGMLTIVPIEMWVRVSEHGYVGPFVPFWEHDYWRSGTYFAVAFPSWEHLWFIVYLWAYTMVAGAVVATGVGVKRWIPWASDGIRLLLYPAAALGVMKVGMMFLITEQRGLLTDWVGHAEFVPLFAFGYILAGNPTLWPALHRVTKLALALAAAAGAIVVTGEFLFPGDTVPPHELMMLDRYARAGMAWWMTIALFALADRYLDRDHRLRRPLARAVFPAYILHHPVIVLTAWLTLPLGMSHPAEFALLLAAAVSVCALGYLLGERVPLVGELIGVPGPDKRAAR